MTPQHVRGEWEAFLAAPEAHTLVGCGPHARSTYAQTIRDCSPYCRRLLRATSTTVALHPFRAWCAMALPLRASAHATHTPLCDRLRKEPRSVTKGHPSCAAAECADMTADDWCCVVDALPAFEDYLALQGTAKRIRALLAPSRAAHAAAFAFVGGEDRRALAVTRAFLRIPDVVRIGSAKEMVRIGTCVEPEELRQLDALVVRQRLLHARLRALCVDWTTVAHPSRSAVFERSEASIVAALRELRGAHANCEDGMMQIRSLGRTHALELRLPLSFQSEVDVSQS